MSNRTRGVSRRRDESVPRDSFGVDGNGDGRKSPYDPGDAIRAAARYLKASGTPGDYRHAIFAYNHADWYVADVLAQAERYRGDRTWIDDAGRARNHA